MQDVSARKDATPHSLQVLLVALFISCQSLIFSTGTKFAGHSKQTLSDATDHSRVNIVNRIAT
jgi:hypothetical protein